MKLNIWANLAGESGYSIHARNLAEALIKAGVDVGIEGSPMPPEPTRYYSDALIEAHHKDYSQEKTIAIVSPDSLALKSGQRLPGLYPFCVFEGDRIPASWAKALNAPHITKVLVPSTHVEKACRASGVTKEIILVPHGVDPLIFNPEAPTKPIEDVGAKRDGRFTFLYVGGWRDGVNDRKGLDIALRAFCAEFKKDEPVRFIAKVNPTYQPNTALLMQQIKDLNLPAPTERPDIQVPSALMTPQQLAGLYRLSDCFVMPSKAEAFCMPVAEAMACGLVTITSEFSGSEDYKHDGEINFGYGLDYALEPATGGVLYEGVKWGRVDQKQLQEFMRMAYDKQELSKGNMVRASKHILENYTWAHSAIKLLKAIQETPGAKPEITIETFG